MDVTLYLAICYRKTSSAKEKVLLNGEKVHLQFINASHTNMHLHASFRNVHMVLLREYIAIEIKLIQRDSSSYVKLSILFFTSYIM